MIKSQDVHVLLVHYNTAALAVACVSSLVLCEEAQVHILDNGSVEVEWAYLVEGISRYPQVSIMRAPENLGFGGGVNALMKALNPDEDDVVWILNPDTIVPQEAFRRLLRQVMNDRSVVVCPVLSTGDIHFPRIWFAGGTIDTSAGVVRHLGQGEPISGLPVEPFESQFLTGAAPMMRARTWKRIGEYRSSLFMYWEDVEWCLRASECNVSLLVDPGSVVWHQVGASSSASGKSPSYFYYVARNRSLVCRDDWVSRVQMVFVSGLFETLRIIVRSVKGSSSSRGSRFVAAVLGTLHGLIGRSGVR